METTIIKKFIKSIIQFVFPLCLGAVILWWVYRDFHFASAWQVLSNGMSWTWMLVSLFFGIMGHVLRGWRWNLTLAPLGYSPRRSVTVYSIFVSYAANLIVPRIGEVSRCGILSRYEGVSFSHSFGTVVTERIIDSLLVLAITAGVISCQIPLFLQFFSETGTDARFLTASFSMSRLTVMLLCLAAMVVLGCYLLYHFRFLGRVRRVYENVCQGILSLRHVSSKWLFAFYTLGIWVCYFLHFYIAFYCFGFTAHLSVMAGLVMFVVGTIAVIVPTPNGAGPWHFAVITMLTLYGVEAEDAGIFALIVHAIQTFLVILLGVYALLILPFTNKKHI